jgi:hypothetical protein
LHQKKNGQPEDDEVIGAPLISCATVGGTAVETAMNIDNWRIFENSAASEDVLKFNTLFLVFVMREVTHALEFYRIPSNVWKKRLRRFERKMLKRLKRQPEKFMHSTYYQLSKFAKRVNKKTDNEYNLRPVMTCGGGVFPVEVQLVPKDATLEIIPKMFHDYCIAKEIPFDAPKCRRHFIENIKNGEEIYLSGVYMYRLIVNGAATEMRYKDTSRDINPVLEKMNLSMEKFFSIAANASGEDPFDEDLEFRVTFE